MAKSSQAPRHGRTPITPSSQGVTLAHASRRLFRCSLATYTGRIVLAQAAIWLLTADRSWAGEETRDDTLALLRGCLNTQSQMDRVSMRVVTERDIPETGDGWPRDQRAQTFIRSDGDRIDIAQTYLLLPQERKEFKERSNRWRAVITNAGGVLYFAGVDMPPPPRGIINNDTDAWFTRYRANETIGAPLDGYFPPTGSHRVAELMAEAPGLRLRGTEAIGGTSCKVVEAQTRHGTYAMWIAESLGFLPLKVTYEIGPDDLHEYSDDRPFSEITIPTRDGKNHAGLSSSGVLEDVTVERIGDVFVPVAGKFTRTEWYTDVRLLAANTYTRTEIELNPSFDGTDAFASDLPEGSYLTNESDKTSGVTYEWRGGKAVPGGTEFRGTPAVESWEKRSSLPQLLSGIVGILLFAAGGRLSFPARTSSEQAAATGERTPSPELDSRECGCHGTDPSVRCGNRIETSEKG